jgi:hypothetical protein
MQGLLLPSKESHLESYLLGISKDHNIIETGTPTKF